jgi:predicted PurR-regulated permease PerM
MAPRSRVTRQHLFVAAFFVLLLGLLSLLFSLIEPFLRSFTWAAILVMVFHPLQERLRRWTRSGENLSALLSTLAVLAFMVLPGVFVVLNLAGELPKAYAFLSSTEWDKLSSRIVEGLRAFLAGTFLQGWGPGSLLDPEQVQKQVASALQSSSGFILEKVTGVFKNLAGFLLQALFTSVAMFFFFRDGSRLSRRLVELVPMEPVYRDKVVRTLSVTVTAVVRALFINALVQGLMAGVGFALAGVPVPILLGLLVFVFSFIPFLGAGAIWVPAVIWLFTQDQALAGSCLLAWGLVISTVDNFIKPWLIGAEAKLPVFWLFFSTLGGLKVYGFLGIFLGPILLSLGMAFLSIYKEVYLPIRAVPARKGPRRRR